MKREKLPLKHSIKIGLTSGLFFATTMAVIDYFDGAAFSFLKFLIFMIVFGLGMAIFFQFKYTKD